MSQADLDVETLLARLEASLREELVRRRVDDPAMIGVHTGGAWIAEVLHRRLGFSEPLGYLDISFYRDDYPQSGMNPDVRASKLPFRVDGRNIVLIDDVLYTGRTVRAALNEIFDYGRPAEIVLGVLIDRNGRQIPIQADCIGGRVELEPGQRIKLVGPEPLQLTIRAGGR